MKKSNKVWFNVKKNGRVVDAVKALDISLAYQEAIDKWALHVGPTDVFEVELMPAAVHRVIHIPSAGELKEYGHNSAIVPMTGYVLCDFTK